MARAQAAALATLGVTRVALVTPYIADLAARNASMLESTGVRMHRWSGGPMPRRIGPSRGQTASAAAAEVSRRGRACQAAPLCLLAVAAQYSRVGADEPPCQARRPSWYMD